MNLALFFEGTGKGVAGKVTNVTRLHNLCREDEGQHLHLESGPGTHVGALLTGAIHGADWQIVFRGARRWFEANYETLPLRAMRCDASFRWCRCARAGQGQKCCKWSSRESIRMWMDSMRTTVRRTLDAIRAHPSCRQI